MDSGHVGPEAKYISPEMGFYGKRAGAIASLPPPGGATAVPNGWMERERSIYHGVSHIY